MRDCGHRKLYLPTEEYQKRIIQEENNGRVIGNGTRYCTVSKCMLVDAQDEDSGEWNTIEELREEKTQ